MRSFLKKRSKKHLFWGWFSKHSNRYLNFENDQTNLFLKLKAQLEKVDPHLTFEFSPRFEDGSREFVISADGIKSSFTSVIDLTQCAPPLNNWKIVAFRQPHKKITQINYQNLIVELDDVYFNYTKDNGKLGLQLHIKGFQETPEWAGISFVLLDTILGEYDTEMSLSWIDQNALNKDQVTDLLPISQLLNVIRGYKLEFNN